MRHLALLRRLTTQSTSVVVRSTLVWFAITLAPRTPAAAQTPLLNPANGHYYARVNSAAISWTAARSAAEAMSYMGAPGHLATSTDAQENQWIAANFASTTFQSWLGGFQDHTSPGYSEPSGGWKWVTGEAWSFTAWSSGEPNDAGGEDFLGMFSSSAWNDETSDLTDFIVEYDYGAVGYCTAGTTSSGCVPSMSSTGMPSASSSSGFTITAASIEGLKQGILFYGVDNTGFSPSPWAATSTSYLCVKHPTQRTPTQNSGGSFGQCDGSLALDWNAYVSSHPSALGSPFTVGRHVYAQGWFRDPPSPKTTMLTGALEFVVGP